MKKNDTMKIEIPKGSFKGNCSDCRYADWTDVDKYGRVYCQAGYGYNKANDRNGCFKYERK